MTDLRLSRRSALVGLGGTAVGVLSACGHRCAGGHGCSADANTFGFDGFVVSDYTGIQELILHGVAGDGADAAAAGITAGVDMEMVSTNYVDFGSQLLAQGRVSRREIAHAVRRILRVKFALGLFEHPSVDASNEVTAVSDAARASARAAAGRSMVLMKNDKPCCRCPVGPASR